MSELPRGQPELPSVALIDESGLVEGLSRHATVAASAHGPSGGLRQLGAYRYVQHSGVCLHPPDERLHTVLVTSKGVREELPVCQHQWALADVLPETGPHCGIGAHERPSNIVIGQQHPPILPDGTRVGQ